MTSQIQDNIKLNSFPLLTLQKTLRKLAISPLNIVFVTGGDVIFEVELSYELLLRGDDHVMHVGYGPLGVSSRVGGLEAVNAGTICLDPSAVP